ncbi:hypothetical protein [Streptomyces sp. WAC08241]|uniref:hypothetical protein n=1 Tax=Streptomyces sp. WAC08241 TaxID=2487421 RepID=UPI000F79E791|nr:hypothetical protein [Streptomyces sp. WAC08241]RSS36809.1 hypothetical protein EF906_24430 [Streptomyces sp. WAC08241]
MSAPDQDTPATGSPKAPGAPKTADEAAAELTDAREDGPEGEADGELDGEDGEFGGAGERREGGLTPRQARRLRVAAASVLLVALAVVLVVRLASRTSVLVVGVYGLAMILCGVVIELSRNGRTRLGTWLLAGGLLAALALDWLVLP